MGFVAVLEAAVVAYGFGAIWYMALSRPWMKAAGIALDAAGKPQGSGSAAPFVIGFACILIVAGMMRHMFAMAGIATLGAGLVGGFGLGAFLITPWVVMNYAYAARPRALMLIDGTYSVVGASLIGAVLTLF